MRRRLPPLNSLRAFEAAARHLSFKEAARELGVTPGAISQQVKQLEDQCGGPLFHRLTRALVLTEAGRLAAPRLKAAFDQLADAYATAANRDARQLVVTASPSLASRWLVPRLTRFRAQHPELEVLIDASDRLIDLEREAVDVAIRFGSGTYPGLIVERLLPERIFPVCSPDLLRGPHPLRRPEDLVHHTLLHHSRPGGFEADPAWEMWLRAAGVEGVHASRGPRFSHLWLSADAAAAGQGVALAHDVVVTAELASGRLVRPFCDLPETLTAFSYFLVYAPFRADVPKVKAFRDWAHSEAGAFLADDPGGGDVGSSRP